MPLFILLMTLTLFTLLGAILAWTRHDLAWLVVGANFLLVLATYLLVARRGYSQSASPVGATMTTPDELSLAQLTERLRQNKKPSIRLRARMNVPSAYDWLSLG